MVRYGDRSDQELSTILKALQHGFQMVGPGAPPHLATLAASDEEVALLLRRVGVPTHPEGERPLPSLMAPLLHIELRSESKELLASLNWGKAEMKATLVALVTGSYFAPSGLPPAVGRNTLLDPLFERILNHGLANEDAFGSPLALRWRDTAADVGPRLDVVCQPWSFRELPDGTWAPSPGRATGTCYRNTSFPQARQIFNLYTQHHFLENTMVQQLIRHSVIDSPERAHMLVSLLQQLELGSKRRVRTLNLLTRRQGEEEALWQQQQAQMSYLKEQLAEKDVELIHLSFQANANCNYNFWNQGEDANTISNATAWLTYARWLLADLLSFIERYNLPESLKVPIEEGLASISASMLMPIKSPQRAAWFFSRLTLDDRGPALYAVLRALADHVLPSVEQALRQHCETLRPIVPDTTLLVAVPILCRLIRSQYPPSGDQARHSNDEKVLNRVCEFLSLALLDRLLGVVSCMNCKSGCDRSGLVHALTSAANIVFDSHPDAQERTVFARVCMDFDGLAEVADEHAGTFEQYVASLVQWQRRHRGDTDLALILVTELRNWMFVVLMDIGWRINIQSTGLAGLKFHLGTVSANPHVASALPPYILGKTSETEEGYQAIGVHDSRRLHLTRRVADFINGAAQFRGA